MKKNFSELFIFVWIFFVITPALTIWADETIDFSEKMMKMKGGGPNDFGETGFGVFDVGDNTYKIFNWKFDLIMSFPISIGEGPGEIKPSVYNAFLFGDHIWINGKNNHLINIYSRKGEFRDSLDLAFQPGVLIAKKNLLYAFNKGILNENEAVLGKTWDLNTRRIVKEIRLKSSLRMRKDMSENTAMNFVYFDVADNGLICLLHSLEDSVLLLNENGSALKEIRLPLPSDVTTERQNVNGDVAVTLNTRAFYNDIKCVGGALYVTFLKVLKLNKQSSVHEYETILVKISEDGKISQFPRPGSQLILGQSGDRLFLFNRHEYKITPVKI